MVKLNRKLCEVTWWGEQGKSPTAEFYMGEVGGRVFGGVNGFIWVRVTDSQTQSTVHPEWVNGIYSAG